jgi:hypothetical protein
MANSASLSGHLKSTHDHLCAPALFASNPFAGGRQLDRGVFRHRLRGQVGGAE